ncbi:Internalin-A [Halioglobus japonicus]|nr:Internalin-A [Halioglobus japonicus]
MMFDLSDLSPITWLTSLQSLNIFQTKVADLSPISSLHSLRYLHLEDTRVSDLGPLALLSNLHTLGLRNTLVRDISPLDSLISLTVLDLEATPVSTLDPLISKNSLRSLYLNGTNISDLKPLAALCSLKSLELGNTIVNDLEPIAALCSLEELFLNDTKVSDLKPLAKLSSLKRIDLASTKVSDLTPLAKLSSLKRIDLTSTKVSDLTPLQHHIEGGMGASLENRNRPLAMGVLLSGCPLIHPPPEIVSKGRQAILSYFGEIKSQGVDQLYEAKILIVGEGGAGKTSLLRRLYLPDEPLPNENETTKGIDIYQEYFPVSDNRNFQLNVWDFGGQEIYHATHQFFLTKRSLYVLLDDTRTNDKAVTDAGFKYWLEVIDVLSDGSPVLIFQNEKGGRSKDIDIRGIKGRFENVQDVYQGDLNSRNAVEKLREDIQFYVQKLPHVGDEVPAKWVSIRNDIERVAKESPYISEKEYFEIYEKHLEFDRQKALFLSGYLHDLGVFLHFQDHDLLSRIVILQNEWATEAVFRILDDESIKQSQGHFTWEDCEKLWDDSGYAEIFPELLALMERFELCYALPDTIPKQWIAPQLLKSSKPEIFNDWETADDLALSYRYEFLPKGLISRLMVRMNRYVKDTNHAWANGVLFEHENAQLLVQLMSRGDEIMLRARGSENKTLLSVIAEDLDALNSTFSGLENKLSKRVPCVCSQCKASLTPEFFDQKELVRRKQHGKLRVECRRSFEDVSVLAILDGFQNDDIVVLQGSSSGNVLVSKNNDAGKTSNKLGDVPMQTIRIFLASSSELSEERDAFDLYFRQQNDLLLRKGLYLEIVRWENFLDAMSTTRLQEEYNEAVRQCDIFVSLFLTKTGRFTEEEFEVAHKKYSETGKPYIYTFFKDDALARGHASRSDLDSLWKFQDKLKELEHYFTEYKNLEDLKLKFRDQLEMLLGLDLLL